MLFATRLDNVGFLPGTATCTESAGQATLGMPLGVSRPGYTWCGDFSPGG